jgi:protease-4
MKAFLKYFFAALLAIFAFCFLLVIIFAGMSSMSGDGEIQVDDSSILHLTFENQIVDRQNDNQLQIDFNTLQPIKKDGLNNILKQISKAKIDDRIEGIFLDISGASAGLATLQEIRDALEDFKTSGKWIASYSDGYTQSGYYLASTANEVYMQPEGMLDFRGLR